MVYCLVSNDSDIYWEEALLSMYSAKYYNPDAHIELVVDTNTNNGFHDGREEILKYVDKLHVLNLPNDFNNKQKSRLLKLSVRQIVSGTFLFIDTDTIIIDKIDDIDKFSENLAAVPDGHFGAKNFTFNRNRLKDMLSLVQCDASKLRVYYNSGVIFAKDTPDVHEFYQRWKNNYLKNLATGLDFDQPNLALTTLEIPNVMKDLPDIYDCQIRNAYVPGAKILHYFNIMMKDDTNESERIPLFEKDLYYEIKQTHKILPEVRMMIANPYSQLHTFAPISHIEWYETTALGVVYNWKNSRYAFVRMEYQIAAFLLCTINNIEHSLQDIFKKIRHF